MRLRKRRRRSIVRISVKIHLDIENRLYLLGGGLISGLSPVSC